MKNFIVIILISLFGVTNAQTNTPVEYQPEKRIALVIGNGNYPSNELPNTENDASAMEKVLERLDFKVYKYENLDKSQMEKAIHDFGKRLKDYDVCLFYYSGQGYSISQTLLVPTDATPESEDDFLHQCLGLNLVLDIMDSANIDVKIIMLEASRTNPIERSWTRSSKGSGLAFMNAPTGSIVAYATSPGSSALVGEDNHGLYTSAILECIEIRDINILQMLQKVRRIVMETSGGSQIPWESTSLRGEFYFNKTE